MLTIIQNLSSPCRASVKDDNLMRIVKNQEKANLKNRLTLMKRFSCSIARQTRLYN